MQALYSDFLDVRQFDVDDSSGIYTVAQESVLSNVLPPAADTKRVVRGHNGPNFWRIKPIDNGRRASFEWFNNTNLRVRVHNRVCFLNQSLSGCHTKAHDALWHCQLPHRVQSRTAGRMRPRAERARCTDGQRITCQYCRPQNFRFE